MQLEIYSWSQLIRKTSDRQNFWRRPLGERRQVKTASRAGAALELGVFSSLPAAG
jgi:hypothetical protein